MKFKSISLFVLSFFINHFALSQLDTNQDPDEFSVFMTDSAYNANYNFINNLLDSAEINYKSGNYKTALNYYDEILNTKVSEFLLEDYNEDSLKDTFLGLFAQLSSKLYDQRGQTKLKLEDFQGALDDFKLAVIYDSKNMIALMNKAKTGGLLGHFNESLEDFNEVLEIDKNNSIAYFFRGSVKAELGDRDGACIDWKKASELGQVIANDYITKYCK